MKQKVYFIVFFLLLAISQTFGATRTVCSSGATYTSIQSAINAANAGDTIAICAGTYNEAITINKNNLTVMGTTGNRDDVVIQNSTNANANAITIDSWPSSVTLRDLSVVQNRSSRYGIYISTSSPSNGITFDNISVTSQGHSAIYFAGQSSNVKINNAYLHTLSSGEGIELVEQNNNGFVLSNTTIDSADNAIQMHNTFNGGVSISDSTLNAPNGIALYFIQNVYNGLTLSGVHLSAERGLHVTLSVTGGMNLTNTTIVSTGKTAYNNGIYIGTQLNGGVNITSSKITSSRYGMYFGGAVTNGLSMTDVTIDAYNTAINFLNTISGGVTLDSLKLTSQNNLGIDFASAVTDGLSMTDVTIDAYNTAINFVNTISGGVTMDTLKLTSQNNRGIDFSSHVYGTCTITKTYVVSDNEALYFGLSAQPTITLSSFHSRSDNGAYFNLDNYNTLTIAHSCFTTEKNNKYALNLSFYYVNNVNVSSSCFYATASNRLAYAPHTGSTFSGNYWDGVSGSYSQNNISDTSVVSACSNNCSGTLSLATVEYRMDECSWNGTSGEVKDSSGNGYNATAKGTTISQLSTQKINNGALFQRAKQQYVQVPALQASKPNFNDGFTVTTWAKFSGTAGSWERIFDFGRGENQNNIFLGRKDTTNTLVLGIHESASNADINVYLQAPNTITDTDWHFWAVTCSGSTCKLYKDGGEIASSSTMNIPSNVARTSNYLGRSNWAVDSYLEGGVDEFKVFDDSLSASQISDIYTYESTGYNYDGTTRDSVECGPHMCFTDDFDRSSLGSKWSIISTGTYPPDITDNKLMLTKNNTKISSGVSLIGDFPSSNNLVEIEFEHNAYAGNGADGVTVILSDANTTPITGAFGGSLGYSPKDSTFGFAGAWLGFGLDEYGNFANDSDGNQGRECSYRHNTAVVDSVTIRGRGEADRLNGYCFIANSGTLAPGIDDVESKTAPAPKNKYKFTIDTRSGTKLTVQRDINDGNGYVTLPNMNAVDATQTAAAPENFKLSFTGSTGDNTNYHSFDNLSIKALSCGTLGEDQNNTNSYFDAWEVGAAYNISNRIIQTKIVKSDFNLNVFALNETNTAYQDFNGTVCVRLVDSNNKNLTDWTKLLFNQTNPYINLATFNSDYVSKDARVAFSWKKDVDTTCPLSVEDNNTKSTDHFAIRPNKFTIFNATTAYAGDNFTLDFKALNASSTNSLDYNESKDGSFAVTSVIGISGCANGVLNVSDFNFADGQKLAVDSNFSDVGDINITIAERSNFEFAKIDSTDTSDTNRLITPATLVVTVKPYELNVTDANFTASTGQNWLYDANVSDMFVRAHATVQANNMQHTALLNFTDVCYAQPVDLTFHYDANNTNANTNVSYVTVNGTMSSALKQFSDINKTITIPTTLFTTASASADYRFNIDRAYNVPLSPIDMVLKEVKVTSMAVSKIVNNKTVVGTGEHFYYGRVKTKDIVTDKTLVPHLLHVEVYSPTVLSGFYQSSLNWYINGSDDGTTILVDGNFSINKGFINNQPFTPVTAIEVKNTQPMADGIVRFNINNPSNVQNSTVHVDVPYWLWNSNIGDYNNSLGTTCANHPCFNYKYIKDVDAVGIKSGTTNGSTIGSDYNASYQKTGVKTFR